MFMYNYMLTPEMPIPNSIVYPHFYTPTTFFKNFSDFVYNGIPQIIFIFINKDTAAFMCKFDSGDQKVKFLIYLIFES